MNLLEALDTYRSDLEHYRALRQKKPKSKLYEPSGFQFWQYGLHVRIAAFDIRDEVLGHKKPRTIKPHDWNHIVKSIIKQ